MAGEKGAMAVQAHTIIYMENKIGSV